MQLEKVSLSDLQNIRGLFVNTLTADEKYSLLNRDKLLQYFQMQLSQNQKVFSQFLLTFCRFRLHFKDFQKKYDPHR